MKKLLAIAVVFALVAGAAFAETSVSGAVETRFTLVNYQDTKDVDPNMYGSIGAAYIQLSGTNDDGTLGGLFRFRNTDSVRADSWYHRVFVWWRPVEQLEIFLGIDNDGKFDTAGIAGWGFHQGDNDYLFNHHWDFWRAVFPGNWDGFGLAFTVRPADGVTINLAIPTGGINWPQATSSQVEKKHLLEDILPWGLRFSAGIAIPDIGQLNIIYNLQDKVNPIYGGDAFLSGEAGGDKYMGRFGVNFALTSLEAMEILVGGSVLLPGDKTDDTEIAPGAAFTYTGEGFGVKARVGAIILDDSEKTFVTFNVMPYFDLGPGSLMIDIGASVDLTEDYENNFGWYATPTYRLPLSGGKFSIGLQLHSNIKMGGNIGLRSAGTTKNDADTDIRVAIPMLLSFNF